MKKFKVYTDHFLKIFGAIPDAGGPLKFYNSVRELKDDVTYWKEVGIFEWLLVPNKLILKEDMKLAMKNAKTHEEWEKIRKRKKKDPEYKEYIRLKKKFE